MTERKLGSGDPASVPATAPKGRGAGMLVITRGLPASGKTTWAKNCQESVGAVRANRDDLRRSLFGKTSGLSYTNEETITAVQTAIVKDALPKGYLVIVDDTNLKLAHARRWANLAKAYGVEFRVQDFTDVSLAECLSRNEHRKDGFVPPDVIQSFYDRYLSHGRTLPDVVADDDVNPRQYTGTPGKPDAWIVDIDGTLAINDGHRSPFDYSKVHLDKVNYPVSVVVEGLWSATEGSEHEIVIVSGRSDDCREATGEWLDEEFGHWGETTGPLLFMRKFGDHRKDSVVKEEIFWRDIAPNWNVIGVLDDRQQVVDMWRSIGLTCFQVAEGNF